MTTQELKHFLKDEPHFLHYDPGETDQTSHSFLLKDLVELYEATKKMSNGYYIDCFKGLSFQRFFFDEIKRQVKLGKLNKEERWEIVTLDCTIVEDPNGGELDRIEVKCLLHFK